MQPTLTTPRLTLRPLAADDGPELARVFAGAGVRRYLFDNEEVSPDTLAVIVGESLRQRPNGLGLWLIDKDDGMIGCIGLHRAPPQTVKIFPMFDGEIEAIVALMEEHWGKGYAKEALEAALAYATDKLSARRIVAVIDVPNEKSRAVFLRCGFGPIGSGQGPLYAAIGYEKLTRTAS
jgi:RimJ/RimL family protein N-acetyltransferase